MIENTERIATPDGEMEAYSFRPVGAGVARTFFVIEEKAPDAMPGLWVG